MLKFKNTGSGSPLDYGTTLWNSISRTTVCCSFWETALYDGTIFYCCFISFFHLFTFLSFSSNPVCLYVVGPCHE